MQCIRSSLPLYSITPPLASDTGSISISLHTHIMLQKDGKIYYTTPKKIILYKDNKISGTYNA